MGFALFALSSIAQPLRHHALALAGRYRTRTALHGHEAARPAQAISSPCPVISAKTPTQRPLRVILNHNSDGGPCRLVISGRMADVCAELDRLALLH